MEILLEEFYKQDLHTVPYIERAVHLDDANYQITGIAQCGKTTLVKNYLLSLKKSSYLYIDLNDIRINYEETSPVLTRFCNKNEITTVVLDNYHDNFELPRVQQVITVSEHFNDLVIPNHIILRPLSFEEFLAYEHKYDSTALTHYIQLGGFPMMQRLYSDERYRYLQTTLKTHLNDIEFSIMVFAAKMASQKVSAFTIYERLKNERRISKDKLYKLFDLLLEKGYLFQLAKSNHPRATKKLYLGDIAMKNALSASKNFGWLFENLAFLELHRRGIEIYYEDGIDFYLPQNREVVLALPFGNERVLFKKIEAIEGFILSHNIQKVTALTMSLDSSISHPFAKINITPFSLWALGDS